MTVVAAACGGGSKKSSSSTTTAGAGIHKIKHVVVIQQENRSFDTYFGTFPGADGIPMHNGTLRAAYPGVEVVEI